MTRFADPSRCPDCRAPLPEGSLTCPRCGLDLSGPLGTELFLTLTRADTLVGLLRARSRVGVAAPVDDPAAPLIPDTDPVRSVASPPRARALSVPQVLLGLGAACLLVAALVFLAVTWSSMGIGGRTATLVALTAAMAAFTGWAARRGLRGAAEALGLVSLGLAVLDLYGADSAGWLGEPTAATMAVIVGGFLVITALPATGAIATTRAARFTSGEVLAGLGAGVLSVGIAGQTWGSAATRMTLATGLVCALCVALWRFVRAGNDAYRVASWIMVPIALLDWFALAAVGLERFDGGATMTSAWLHLESWPLLAAAGLTFAVATQQPLPKTVRVAFAAVGLLPLCMAVLAPATDESTTTIVLAVVALAAGLVVLTRLAPTPWSASGTPAAGLCALFLGVHLVEALELSVERYATAAAAGWDGTLGGHLPALRHAEPVWLLPVCAVTVAALVWVVLRLVPASAAVDRSVLRTVATTTAVATAVATMLLLPIPVWTVVAAGLVGALVVGWPALTRDEPVAAATGALGLAATLPLSAYDEHLNALTLLAALLVVGTVHLRSRRSDTSAVAGALATCLLTGLTWTVGAVVGADATWTGLVGLLLLAGLVLTQPLVPAALRRIADASFVEIVVELTCGVAAAVLAAAALASTTTSEQSTWAAVYLTVAGVAASSLALLRDDRRPVAWLGGALLVAATWVRLADLGVHAPEPYTLPAALALIAVGLRRLRRHPSTPTITALSAGLGLALAPSLLWALEEPTGPRPVLLGIACLALVVAAARLRWSAPMLYGSLTGLALVLREAAPYLGDSVPRWGLIGAAGAVLIALGVTWEQRLAEARAVSAYVRDLR